MKVPISADSLRALWSPMARNVAPSVMMVRGVPKWSWVSLAPWSEISATQSSAVGNVFQSITEELSVVLVTIRRAPSVQTAQGQLMHSRGLVRSSQPPTA